MSQRFTQQKVHEQSAYKIAILHLYFKCGGKCADNSAHGNWCEDNEQHAYKPIPLQLTRCIANTVHSSFTAQVQLCPHASTRSYGKWSLTQTFGNQPHHYHIKLHEFEAPHILTKSALLTLHWVYADPFQCQKQDKIKGHRSKGIPGFTDAWAKTLKLFKDRLYP